MSSPRHDGPGGRIRSVLWVLTLVGVTLWLVTTFVARPFTVAGRSMTPTLDPGDRVVVDLTVLRHRDPRPGEIVLFAGPDGRRWVKRVVRRNPGIDGRARFWVAGDNALDSADSRTFGEIPRPAIVGRVVWRYWPPSRAGAIR